MSGFYYYVPGVQANSRELRATINNELSYAFSYKPSERGVTGGPDNGTGVLLCGWKDGAKYVKDSQVWRKIPKSECWIGYDNGSLPTAGNLARKKMLDGHLVELGNGESWLAPVARGLTEQDGELRYYVNVPQRITLDDNGKWTRQEAVDSYKRLWDIAESFNDLFSRTVTEQSEDRSSRIIFDFQGELDYAVEALQTNYRISRIEASLLDLLTEESAHEILRALIDYPSLVEFSKKKRLQQQEDSASNAGSEG